MDELNSHARALLDAANTFDDPTDMDRDRVRAAVLMRVGSVAAVGTATVAAAKASSAAASAGPLLASTLTSAALFSSAAAKLGAVVVLGALATVGAYIAFHPAHHSAAPVPAAKPTLAPLAAPVGAAIPPAAVDAQPAVSDAVDLPTDDAKPSPAHPHARNADLEGEMKLLRQADAALRRGDSAAALAAVNKHAALYPSGVLSQEREGVRAIALCSAGSMSQGQAAARRFLEQASKSPLSSRIRSACSIDQ
jgi:hypothetical protein